MYRIFDVANISINDVAEITMQDVKNIYENQSDLVFPDYVYDKHTDRGKQLGRGFQHFYDEGAKLVQCYIDDSYEATARKNNCE